MALLNKKETCNPDSLNWKELPKREIAFQSSVKEVIRTNTSFPTPLKSSLSLRFPLANSPSLIDPLQIDKPRVTDEDIDELVESFQRLKIVD